MVIFMLISSHLYKEYNLKHWINQKKVNFIGWTNCRNKVYIAIFLIFPLIFCYESDKYPILVPAIFKSCKTEAWDWKFSNFLGSFLPFKDSLNLESSSGRFRFRQGLKIGQYHSQNFVIHDSWESISEIYDLWKNPRRL